MQSNSFLLTRLQGCILFKGWPGGLCWQVNRGLCLAASVGTSFMMCKSCIVLVVFIAFTEVIHSFQLYNWNASRSWIIATKWPDLQKVTTACLSGGREGWSQGLVHDSMFTRRLWLVLSMTLKYICFSCSQVWRRGFSLCFTLFSTLLILNNGAGFVVVFLWHWMSSSPSNTKILQQ